MKRCSNIITYSGNENENHNVVPLYTHQDGCNKNNNKKKKKINVRENVKKLESSHTAGRNVKPLWKTIWWLLKKLNIPLSYHPENLLEYTQQN